MYAWKEGSRTCQYDNLRDVLRFLTVEEALVCFEWPRSEVLPWFCSRGGKCHNIYFEEWTGWRKTFYCLYSCIVYLFSDSAQNLLSRQPTILPSGLVKKWSQSLLGLTYGHPVHMNVETVVSCGAAGQPCGNSTNGSVEQIHSFTETENLSGHSISILSHTVFARSIGVMSGFQEGNAIATWGLPVLKILTIHQQISFRLHLELLTLRLRSPCK